MHDPEILLASLSPRRREIMHSAGYDFRVVPSRADEQTRQDDPAEMVKELSARKAAAVAVENPGDIVIGADTVVSIGGRILQKPRDAEDAVGMLSTLSGKTHDVFTGVTVTGAGKTASFFVKTEVKFYPLPEEIIRGYVETGEPLDKAGGYGIQGRGALLVERIRGDYFNVMGLPISAVARILRENYGIRPF